MAEDRIVIADSWANLRKLTAARIALGRAGGSLPTGEWLEFKAAHAKARDAVHESLDVERLSAKIGPSDLPVIAAASAARDRAEYLRRPDLGRRLDEPSRQRVKSLNASGEPFDVSIILSDGLSAQALQRQAPPLLEALLPRLLAANWTLAPLVIARLGRVALQDEIGSLIGANIALTLIGERPGLDSHDSLGAYLAYGPKPGNTDANRNCVSNIRPEGLAPAAAADLIFYLLCASRRRQLSGVLLKDERPLGVEATAASKAMGVEPR